MRFAIRPSAAMVLSGGLLLGLVACAPEPLLEPTPSSPASESVPRPPAEESETATTLPSTTPEASAKPNTVVKPRMSQAEFDDHLRQAAWADDVDSAEQLIAWGANVNAKDQTRQSAYLIATSEGHLDFLRLTLAHGAKVRSLDSWNGTGLIRAAERGH